MELSANYVSTIYDVLFLPYFCGRICIRNLFYPFTLKIKHINAFNISKNNMFCLIW